MSFKTENWHQWVHNLQNHQKWVPRYPMFVRAHTGGKKIVLEPFFKDTLSRLYKKAGYGHGTVYYNLCKKAQTSILAQQCAQRSQEGRNHFLHKICIVCYSLATWTEAHYGCLYSSARIHLFIVFVLEKMLLAGVPHMPTKSFLLCHHLKST